MDFEGTLRRLHEKAGNHGPVEAVCGVGKIRIPCALQGEFRYAIVDGLPGFVTIEAGGIAQTTALHIEGRLIVAIYVVRNPDKLRHLPEAQIH